MRFRISSTARWRRLYMRAFCLTAQAFSKQGYRFQKPVVVGHWPASNYSTDRICAGIHINREANIYSIDGGNSMKRWGQINILMFAPDGRMTFGAYDGCRKIRVLQAQEEMKNPLTLIFPDTYVEHTERIGEKMRCYLPRLQCEMEFDEERLYTYKDKTYCSDFTTYHLPVYAGEVVSYCGAYEDGILIKREGLIGKYCGPYEWADIE